ncbi:hypothetical protein MGN01_11170 [Methylobacterium gnaphalii]|uniref:HNH nuclease domain-containing protein n=1 Tax=Methylobacterium gnaphalii TaxID=1010610 RepID=A0A512JHC8_9HYPH|nr:hypothetical protein MGN01_11170 [Methylobacterium gnaphalii]GLS50995.1 hypothetical protein GCM10007885_38490 [Methylobacterium gnaphalii]
MARPNARARGYSSAWDKARAGFLRSHPNCARCPAPASVVHHRRPHRGNQVLFWDRTNWEALCKPCHDGPAQREEQRGYFERLGLDGLPNDPRHPFNRPDAD